MPAPPRPPAASTSSPSAGIWQPLSRARCAPARTDRSCHTACRGGAGHAPGAGAGRSRQRACGRGGRRRLRARSPENCAAPCCHRGAAPPKPGGHGPEAYGRLFVVLASYAHTPEDDRPTWLDMARRLNAHCGTRFSRHALKKTVHRLLLGRPARARPPKRMRYAQRAEMSSSECGIEPSRARVRRLITQHRVLGDDMALTT
jgi:hypothetical protein